METRIYTDYNPYAGLANNPNAGVRGYDFRSGTEPQLLPPVNLFNNFNFKVYGGYQTSARPTTSTNSVFGGTTSYAQRGYRTSAYGNTPSFGVSYNTGINIIKIITSMEWVFDLGPKGNAVCQNELGDWLTYEALSKPDSKGHGITLGSVPQTGTEIVNLDMGYDGDGPNTITFTAPKWNYLTIQGAYNSAVFYKNQFDYTNDDEGTIFTARSLYDLPNKIDNLVTFIPDQREQSTLRFYIDVHWTRSVTWGLWGDSLSTSTKDSILNSYGNAGMGESGTDRHMVTHVVQNNNNNYPKILREILNKRQRSLEQQDKRYGQTFPKTEISVTSGT
jgi:hypothetical protein